MPSSASSSSSQQYHAVRVGHQVGIFTTDSELHAAITDFPHAQYQSFDDLAAAQAYIAATVTVAPAVLKQLQQQTADAVGISSPTVQPALPNNIANSIAKQSHEQQSSSASSSSSSTPHTQHHLLSIQSTVVHGYVGLKVSTFPLQLYGIDVDPLSSCQLSNHTGYKSFTGKKNEAEDVRSVVKGLEANDVLSSYNSIITGYLSNPSFAEAASELVQDIVRGKYQSPDSKSPSTPPFYLCDPVLGDNGKLYVPEPLINVYQSLIESADVVTPNSTECEFLTNMKISTLDDCYAVCQYFHTKKHIPTVVITSATLADDKDSVIHVVASTMSSSPGRAKHHSATTNNHTSAPSTYLHLKVPKRSGYYSGTGDLMSALLLMHLTRDNNLQSALEKSIASVQAVIEYTASQQSQELCLIQCKHQLEQPVVKIKAEVVQAPAT